MNTEQDIKNNVEEYDYSDKSKVHIELEDVGIDSKINTLNIEALNKNEDRIINKVFNVYHVRSLVCGSTGSGKTTFILNYLFQNLDTYGLVIYCAPTETIESGLINSIIKNKILDKYFYPIDIRKDALPTITELQSIQKNTAINQMTGKHKRIALILDDFINVLTTREDKKQIDAYLTQSSRASCDIFLLVQTYNNISPSIATNVNVLILFLKYMSKDSYNACLRRSFTGSISKELKEVIFNDLKHADNHQPFIFINDQPTDRSIRYMNKYVIEV